MFHREDYRASHVLGDLGWVDLDLGSSPGWWAATVATYCPSRVVEHSKSKSTKPSPRAHGTPCTVHGRCLVWLVGGQKRSATQPDYSLLTIGYLPLSLHKKGPITILTFSILRYEDPIHCHHMQPQTDAKCRPNYSHILNNTIRIFYLACSG